MKLNLLNKEELTNLYKDEMMFDFPRAELKPLRAMLRLMDMGQYDPLLVTADQGVALGSAIIWLPREAEAPTSDDPAENDLRRRRIAFYERNGFRVLDYECALFGVHFNCLYLGPETDDRKVEALHCSVYADYFSPEHMARYIQLPLHPGEAIQPSPAWVEEDEEEVFP